MPGFGGWEGLVQSRNPAFLLFIQIKVVELTGPSYALISLVAREEEIMSYTPWDELSHPLKRSSLEVVKEVQEKAVEEDDPLDEQEKLLKNVKSIGKRMAFGALVRHPLYPHLVDIYFYANGLISFVFSVGS